MLAILLFLLCICHFGYSKNDEMKISTKIEVSSSFATVYDNALPRFLFDKLEEEAKMVSLWSSKQTQFLHSKKTTFWLSTHPIQHRPRSFIELAVLMLKRYVDHNNTILNLANQQQITGAEWWVQEVDSTSDIGFHYDKDEAAASLEHRMEFPLLSTVTYLRDCGGPTIIFNKTTDSKGNMNIPPIPENGYVIFPKMNRHLHFQGHLEHGVVGSASQNKDPQCRRLTLLINWWSKAPREPNCIKLSEDSLRSMNIANLVGLHKPTDEVSAELAPIVDFDEESARFCSVSNDNDQSESISRDSVSQLLTYNFDFVENLAAADNTSSTNFVTLTLGIMKSIVQSSGRLTEDNTVFGFPPVMTIPKVIELPSPEDSIQYEVEFPPGDICLFYLPKKLHQHGAYYGHWKEGQIYGNVGKLNLNRQAQVTQLFHLKEPKLLFLYDGSSPGIYSSISPVAFHIARKYLFLLKVYLCSTETCSDALRVFQLTKDSLPKVVFHDTVNERIEIASLSQISVKKVVGFLRSIGY